MSRRAKRNRGKSNNNKGTLHTADVHREQRLEPITIFRPSAYMTQTRPYARVMLRWVQVFTVSGAATSVTKRFNPNSVYTPEVGGSNAAVPTFSEYAALYSEYRVRAFTIKVEATNNEAFAVVAYCLNLVSDPGTSAGTLYATDRYSYSRLIPAKGGMDRWEFTTPLLTVDQIVSSKDPTFDDSYKAATNASPTSLLWSCLGATGSANITLGVTFRIDLEMYVDFFTPKVNA